MKLPYRIIAVILYCICGLIILFPMAFVLYLKSLKPMWIGMKGGQINKPKITKQKIKEIVTTLQEKAQAQMPSVKTRPTKDDWNHVSIYTNKGGSC